MTVLDTSTTTIAGIDPLAILAEAGVDVMNLSPEAREVFDGLSADEARLLAQVNRKLDSIPNLTIEANEGNGGINH